MQTMSTVEQMKYNYIPVSYELISHVRRIDGLDVSKISDGLTSVSFRIKTFKS